MTARLRVGKTLATQLCQRGRKQTSPRRRDSGGRLARRTEWDRMRWQGERLPRGDERRWRLEPVQKTLRVSWLKTRFPTWERSLNAAVEFTD